MFFTGMVLYVLDLLYFDCTYITHINRISWVYLFFFDPRCCGLK